MNYSEELDYLSSTLKLDQPYKTEEKYIKNVSIKDKNELLNHIKNIYQGLSISAETMEYIYYNNCKFNTDQNPFPEWTTNEILYKLGKESPLFKKSTELYYNIMKSIQNDGKEIKNDNNINEDIEMKIEEKNLKEKDIKEKIMNVKSLCDDFEKALEEYNKAKKIDKEKLKEKMEIESKDEDKDSDKKKICVDNVVIVFQDEKKCLEKLKNYEKLI